MTLGPFFSPKIDFFPTRICVYAEDLESGFGPFSDSQEDQQGLLVLGHQYEKVIFLPPSQVLAGGRRSQQQCIGLSWSEEGPGGRGETTAGSVTSGLQPLSCTGGHKAMEGVVYSPPFYRLPNLKSELSYMY